MVNRAPCEYPEPIIEKLAPSLSIYIGYGVGMQSVFIHRTGWPEDRPALNLLHCHP